MLTPPWRLLFSEVFDPRRALRGDDLRLYEPLNDAPSGQIHTSLGEDPGAPKFFLAGSPGSGKSTELAELGRRLLDTHAVVPVDVYASAANVAGVSSAEVLFMIGAAACKVAVDLGTPISDSRQAALVEAFRGVAKDPTRVDAERFMRGTATFGVAVGAVAGGAPEAGTVAGPAVDAAFNLIKRAATTVIDRVVSRPFGGLTRELQESDPEVERLASALAGVLSELAVTRRPVVLVDGLDRVEEPSAIRGLFLQNRLLDLPTCPVVYNEPIFLWLDPDILALGGRFERCPLPNVTVEKPVEGSATVTDEELAAQRAVLARLVDRRLQSIGLEPRAVLPADVLDGMITASGGVPRDLVHLMLPSPAPDTRASWLTSRRSGGGGVGVGAFCRDAWRVDRNPATPGSPLDLGGGDPRVCRHRRTLRARDSSAAGERRARDVPPRQPARGARVARPHDARTRRDPVAPPPRTSSPRSPGRRAHAPRPGALPAPSRPHVELGTVAELQLMLARVEHGAAEYASARSHASIALELGTQLGDPALRGAAIAELARLTTAHCGGPGADASLPLYEDAIAILSGGGVHVSAAVQRANAAVTLYLLGRSREAIDQYERALPALTRSGRHLDAALVRVNQGTARLACGDPEGAWAAATAASEEYAAVADFTGDAHARLLAGRAAAVMDRIQEAEAALGRAKDLAERHGRTRVALHAKRYLGWCAHRRGDLDAARVHYTVELTTGDSPARAYLALWRAWAAGEPDGVAFEELRATLGHDPFEARAGPEFVDATLSRRLVEVGRAARGAFRADGP